MENEKYIQFLSNNNFNQEQIDFMLKQREIYLSSKENEYFDYDTYERDMWYTMNRSGLFENDEFNKTNIYNWGPKYTRLYISELR